jgi:alpha-D-xyloside xylohydrolase
MIDAAAPIDRMPLFVRAGSILPMGPDVEYASEKPADPIELRVYPGANGSFLLYEDEGDNYDYEKGAHATIRFDWDDAARKLTIGERQGKFTGMLEHRTFHIVFADKNDVGGIVVPARPDKIVEYSGQPISISR